MEKAGSPKTAVPEITQKVEKGLDAFFKVGERRYVPPEGTHSGYQYLPGDHLIGEMTQHQRDHILAKLPKTARER